MNITFSANKNEEIIHIPYVPPNISINNPQQNEEFKTINSGTLNILGDMGLINLSLSTFFPTKSYPWLANTATLGWQCVSFFEKWRKAKIPIRVVIMDGEKTILNMPCTIDNFSYSVKQNKDIAYSLNIKEYRFAGF